MRRIEEEELHEEDEAEEENQEELIKRILEESEKVEFKEFDEKQLVICLFTLEKKFAKNQELRDKFPNSPDKFMDSEVELDEEIKRLQQITTHPELLPSFIKNKGVEILMSLLIHDNNDIVGDVIEVLFKLNLDIKRDNRQRIYGRIGECERLP